MALSQARLTSWTPQDANRCFSQCSAVSIWLVFWVFFNIEHAFLVANRSMVSTPLSQPVSIYPVV